MSTKAIVALFVITFALAIAAVLAIYPKTAKQSTPSVTSPSPLPTTNNQNGQLLSRLAPVDSVEVFVTESFPIMVNTVVTGSLSDSCTQIDKVTQSLRDNTFYIQITTKRPQEALCAQVITPFKETIDLDVSGLVEGQYHVDVNGVKSSFEFPGGNTP